MYIYYKTNFLSYKKILNKLNRYCNETSSLIARNSMKISRSDSFEFRTETYSIYINKNTITISHNSSLPDIIKKEIMDYFNIIFNRNFINGYVNDVGKEQEWLLDVITKYNHISTDFNTLSRNMKHGYIKYFREKVEKIMRNDGADDNEIALVSDTSIINAINRNRTPEDVAWAFLQ